MSLSCQSSSDEICNDPRALHIARMLASTIEKLTRAEGRMNFRMSNDCVRVIAETLHAVTAKE